MKPQITKSLIAAALMTSMYSFTQAQAPSVSITRSMYQPIPNQDTLSAFVIDCPGNSFVLAAPTATEVVTYKTITGQLQTAFNGTEEGSYVITWLFQDFYGNTSTQTQLVIVDDTQAPEPSQHPLHPVAGNCRVEVTEAPTAYDACKGLIVGQTSDPLVYTEAGIHTITWIFDDTHGNVIVQEQLVEVQSDPDDNVPPVPSVPSLPTVRGCDVTINAPVALDNCSGELVATTDHALMFPTDGLYDIVWRYTDASGNVTEQAQRVEVACMSEGAKSNTAGMEENTQKTFSVYPNPSTGVVNLEVSNTESYEVEVYDMSGKLSYRTMGGSQRSVDLTSLNRGVYLITLNYSNGERVTRRIILN